MALNPSSHQPATPALAPTDDVLTPTQRAQLQRCFERAKQVLAHDQPDREYAHTMLMECVQRDPGNLVYVEALIHNLQEKFGHNGRGARFRWVSRGGLKRALADEDWPEVLRTGLELLRTNPWDVRALRALAQAAASNQQFEVELWYLKAALNAHPKDIEVNRHCGRSLARLGQFDQAVACWRRVVDRVSGDPEALKMITDLTLAKTLGVPPSGPASGGRTGAGHTAAGAEGTLRHRSAAPRGASTVQVPRRPARKVEETPLTPKPPRPAEMSPADQLRTAHESAPASADAAVQWARHLGQQRNYTDAEAVLSQCLAAGGNQLTVLEELEETRLAAARARLEIAQRRAGMQRTPETVELLADLTGELNRLEIDMYYERCERYPQESRWRLHLGQALKRAGNFVQAIRCFREAAQLTDPPPTAYLELGECLQFLKQFPRALEAYQQAIALPSGSAEDGESRKLALYRAAVLAEALGQPQEAAAWLTQLVALDPLYRDAGVRLTRLARTEA